MGHCTDLLPAQPHNCFVKPLLTRMTLSFPPCKQRAPAPSQEAYEDRDFSVGAGDILSLKPFPLLVGVMVVLITADYTLFLLLVASLLGRTEGHCPDRLKASIPGLKGPYLQDRAAALNIS